MQPHFNINRPPVSDDEIEKHKNFDALVAQFKKQSLKKARGDESWWKNKKIQYATVILGVTVVCTITYQSIRNNTVNQTSKSNQKHEIKNTPKSNSTPSARKSKPFVTPPLASLNKKTTAYKVNNQRGAELHHPSSTRIVVPRGTFVDSKGHEIVGEVTLEYREFDHLPDIIAAGIPMRHDSLGKPYHLESAGMFEIGANQNGQPVSIKNGHPILVDLASYNKENRFNQYYLDTISRNWRFLGPDKPLPIQNAATGDLGLPKEQLTKQPAQISDNPTQQSDKSSIASRSPVKPQAPVKHRQGRPTFVLEGSYDEFPELAAFENVIFEVGPENRNYSPDLHDVTWSDIRITEGPAKGTNYLLNLSHRSRREQLVVYPVLQEKDYLRAKQQYDERLAAYNDAVRAQREQEVRKQTEQRQKQEELARRQRTSEQERLKRVRQAAEARSSDQNQMGAAVVARRLFQVASFGIYNSDHPHAADVTPLMQPVFVDAASRISINPDAIYIIDHRRKTVITCDVSNCYLPGGNNEYSLCLVSLGEVFTCDKTGYKKTVDAASRSFQVTRREGAAENMADFRKALDI